MLNDLAPYGSQRVALSLVEQWSAAGDVSLVTLEAPGQADLAVPPGVAWRCLNRRGSRAWALLVLPLQLRLLVARRRPEHIVSHMTFANVITLLASLGSRLRPVIVEHNYVSRLPEVTRGGAVVACLLRFLHPRAGLVVGVSEAVVEDLHEHVGVPRSRLRCQYNPVPHSPTTLNGEPHPWLASTRPGCTVTCVGGFRRAKGQDLLIHALALLRSSGDTSTRVIFLGDGPLEGDCKAQVRREGIDEAVHFAGYRDDAGSWVARSDVLVMPSRWDSFGLVAVEAARNGVPVLAADVQGLNEIVPCFVPGWLVPPEDPTALAGALADVAAGKAPLPADQAIERFDPREVAAEYLDHLTRLDVLR